MGASPDLKTEAFTCLVCAKESLNRSVSKVADYLMKIEQEDFYGNLTIHVVGGKIKHITINEDFKPEALNRPTGKK